MKNTLLKKAYITAVLISVMYIGNVPAHDIDETLGAAAAATDMYQITCNNDGESGGDSEHLLLELSGNSKVAGLRVSAQVFLNGKAYNTTDAGNGSPEIKFTGGNDVTYILTVNKSAAGNANYHIVYHCESKTGSHTGTIPVPVQSQ